MEGYNYHKIIISIIKKSTDVNPIY